MSLKAYVHVTKPLKTANLEKQTTGPSGGEQSLIKFCPLSGRPAVHAVLPLGNERECTGIEYIFAV